MCSVYIYIYIHTYILRVRLDRGKLRAAAATEKHGAPAHRDPKLSRQSGRHYSPARREAPNFSSRGFWPRDI